MDAFALMTTAVTRRCLPAASCTHCRRHSHPSLHAIILRRARDVCSIRPLRVLDVHACPNQVYPGCIACKLVGKAVIKGQATCQHTHLGYVRIPLRHQVVGPAVQAPAHNLQETCTQQAAVNSVKHAAGAVGAKVWPCCASILLDLRAAGSSRGCWATCPYTQQHGAAGASGKHKRTLHCMRTACETPAASLPYSSNWHFMRAAHATLTHGRSPRC